MSMDEAAQLGEGSEPDASAPPARLYEVQTLITHRVRYAVRARSAEEAAAAVASLDTEAEEFDQNCLGKAVADCREISQEQYLAQALDMGALREEYMLRAIHDATKPPAD